VGEDFGLMCKAITRALGLAPKAPSLPPIEPAPPPPAAVVEDIPKQMETVDAEAQAQERLRQSRARGRASTILTSGEGDTSAPVLARPAATAGRTLLG
jgi:hypothetical protein